MSEGRIEETLDEESIIRLLWRGFGNAKDSDPFNDDAAWVRNMTKRKLLVSKADMMVVSTDAPPQMTPEQIARKSIVACVSDLAAKGVMPLYCLVSIGLPKKFANPAFITGIASGFARAENEYKLKIIGGDTNATLVDPVFDCSVFGYSDSVVKRSGARAGDIVGVTGKFGYPPAGLLVLLGKAKSSEISFEKEAINSVLEPVARLDVGLRASRFLNSCIDSSDGLAISLYHLAESSKVDFELDNLPSQNGLERFAKDNNLRWEDLALFGGEEYELVCTFHPKHLKRLSRLGIIPIGKVKKAAKWNEPKVFMESREVQRKGWFHFISE